MNKYAITITEELSRTVIVEADSLDDAIFKVESAVDKSDIILDAEDYVGREIAPSEFSNDGLVPEDEDVSHYEHLSEHTIKHIYEEYVNNNLCMNELLRSYPELTINEKKSLLELAGDDVYMDVNEDGNIIDRMVYYEDGEIYIKREYPVDEDEDGYVDFCGVHSLATSGENANCEPEEVYELAEKLETMVGKRSKIQLILNFLEEHDNIETCFGHNPEWDESTYCTVAGIKFSIKCDEF